MVKLIILLTMIIFLKEYIFLDLILEEIVKFNKNIKYCKNKMYQFNSTDTCLNGKGCIVKRKILKGLGYYYEIRKIFEYLLLLLITNYCL